MNLIASAFKRLHFPVEIIAQAVRWYLTYALSLRDLEEMLKERGVQVDHATIHRWIHRMVPLFENAYKRRLPPVGGSWRVDETYVKIKGVWYFLYRAVDSQGRTVDFLLTKSRNVGAAKRFFAKAIRLRGKPAVVTLDGSKANKFAVDEINAQLHKKQQIEIRQNKYLNNLIEQDHRFIKRRLKRMLWLKRFTSSKTLISGIELAHMFRKGQYHGKENGLSPAEAFYALAA